MSNHNVISSLGEMSVTATALTNFDGGRITAGDTADFTLSGELLNQGLLTSGSDMQLSASNINNAGTLGSGGQLILQTPGTITNNNPANGGKAGSLIFSAGNMDLFANNLDNRYADIYSIGSFRFALDDSLSRAGSLVNRSGTIESEGDMGLWVDALSNRKDRFGVSERQTSGQITVSCTDCSGTNRNGDATLKEVYQESIVEDSAQAQLVAGGNLRITGQQLHNQHSLISANQNIDIASERLEKQRTWAQGANPLS